MNLYKTLKTILFVFLITQFSLKPCFSQGVFSIPREWQERQEIRSDNLEERSDLELRKGKGRYGSTLTIAMPRVKSFDSQKATRKDVKTIIRCVQEGLYGYDSKNDIIPILATKMPKKIAPNTYLIHLQRGVFFHNEDYFEAKDVVFTLKRLLNPKNHFPRQKRFSNILSVKRVDSYSVEITLKSNYPSIEHLLTSVETFPLSQKAVLKYGDSAYGSFTIVGTGPFFAYEHTKDSSLSLVRNFQYRYDWLPYYSAVNFDFFKTPKKSIKHLLQNRLSIVMGIPKKTVLSYSKKYRVMKAHKGNGGLLEQIYLNTDTAPFNNENCRKGFSFAINREAIVKKVFKGYAVAAKGILPDWIPFHEPESNFIHYDPKKAKEYLELEGYSKRNPLKVIMFIGRDEKFREQAKLIKKQVADVGIDLGILVTSKKDLLSYLYGINGKERNDFQAALEDWTGDESPERYTYPLYYSKSPYNKVHFDKHSFDKNMEKILLGAGDEQKKTLYRKIEEDVISEYSTIPICFVNPVVLGGRHLKDLKVNVDGSLDLKEAWSSGK